MADMRNAAALAGARGVQGASRADRGRALDTFGGLDVQAVVRALLGDPDKRLSSKTDWRFGRRGSLSVEVRKGLFYCHETGAAGGLLDLVVHLGHAADLAGAAAWLKAAGWLRDDARPPPREDPAMRAARAAAEACEARMKRAAARRLWMAAGPIAGTPAARYLVEARGIPAAAFASTDQLRFHPAAPHFPLGRSSDAGPAMVARCVDHEGAAIGVHLTFLSPDGSAKAAIDTPRKMVGAGFMGASVRLFGPARRSVAVVVAEGVESALSAAAVLRLSPVAALSAGGVRSWRAWQDVGSVTLAPDMDASGAGMAAARACAARLHGEGFPVRGFAVPPGGVNDWNDALRAGAVEAIQTKGADHGR